VPQWPGGHVGCFPLAVLAGSPIPMAPAIGCVEFLLMENGSNAMR
jgi:hypothetical protein